jgi:Homeobox KN domain
MSSPIGSGGFVPPSDHDGLTVSRSSKTTVHLEEPRILLPTKVYPFNLEEVEDDNEVDDDDMGYPPSVAFQAYPDSLVQYTAQPVLKWVESLAAAAENAELTDEASPPIEVGGVRLSQRSSGTTRRLAPPSDGSSIATRRSSATGSTIVHGSRGNDVKQGSISSNKPSMFDATFLLEHDAHAWTHVQRINQLALEVEGFLRHSTAPGTDIANPHRMTYEATFARLEFTFGRILHQFPCEVSTDDAELRVLLNTLYESTARRLQRLLDSMRSEAAQAENQQRPHRTTSSFAPESVAPMAAASSVSSSSASSCSSAKKDLGSYMTHWLLMNWTNPYPDDEGLVHLAAECGVTTTVVSNWLINARTRKWRPAIVKATNLEDRPSSMLLEDSIRIFQGRPLRAVAGEGQDHSLAACVRPAKRARTEEM